ncbi:hypothetical protein B0H17DRAFT_1136564 [Mycena rosella]|uniref:Uncharacterized protein n=1 Tax=Mycena rosella TaxID=1033263 RepID=A0AAD7DAU9_MYCRO|nr:hypothetical protein B0H17DRAFT_1136564 [Mycena rosella]
MLVNSLRTMSCCAARSRAHFQARKWFLDLGLPLEHFLLHTARQQRTKRGLAHAWGDTKHVRFLPGAICVKAGGRRPGMSRIIGTDGIVNCFSGKRGTARRRGALTSLVFDSMEVTLERDRRFEKNEEDEVEDEVEDDAVEDDAVDVVEFMLHIDKRRRCQWDDAREGADSMDARAMARVAQPSGSSRSDKTLVAVSKIAVSNIVVSKMAVVRLSAERLGTASDSDLECSDGADGATAA